MIAEYLKIKCPLCDGVGHKERGLFSDPSQMRMGSCHACKGTGKIWALTIEEMAERTSQAEAERDEAREKLNRLNFDRTDNTSPFTRACHLLQDGFISVGKALEWWRVYVNTGNLEPIADGEGESIWDENEKLKARVKELEALLKSILADLPVLHCADLHHARKDRHSGFEECPVHLRLDGAITRAEKMVSARAAEPKTENPPQS